MSMQPLQPGLKLGRYELLQPIAQGGMATVWAARMVGPRGFQKLVAIKIALPALRNEPGAEEMFLAEARVASRIRHPNVVEVLDLGDEGGYLYLVMEWVHGAPLTAIVTAARKRGGLGLGVAMRIIREVCLGLHAAHSLTDETGTPIGLVHRDVSPHNVLVAFSGVAKVADFGIAKVRSATSMETQFGQLKGKIAYMAPEQLRFEQIDQRTDVFAVGVLLYMLTTGVHPFKGDEQHDTVRAILSTDPAASPNSFIEGYPARLERIVLRAISKEPADRYPTTALLAQELSAAIPPTSKGTDLVQEFMREILPDEYERGIELARTAMEPGPGQGGTARSSATFRGVAVDSDRIPSLEAYQLRDEASTKAPPKRRMSAISVLSAAAAVTALGFSVAASLPRLLARTAAGAASESAEPEAARPPIAAPSAAPPVATPSAAPVVEPSNQGATSEDLVVERPPSGRAPEPKSGAAAPATAARATTTPNATNAVKQRPATRPARPAGTSKDLKDPYGP